MADVPAGLVSAYYEILQAGAGSYDPERLRSILTSDLDFEGRSPDMSAERTGSPAASRFIETQHGIRFVQQVATHDAAAVLYDADLPGRYAPVRGVLPFRRRADRIDQTAVRSRPVRRVRRALSPGPIPPTARPGAAAAGT